MTTEDLSFETSINHFTLRFKDRLLNESYAARKPISFLLLMVLQIGFLLSGLTKTLHLSITQGDSWLGFVGTLGVGIFQFVFELLLYKYNKGQMLRGYSIVIGNAIGCILNYSWDVSGRLDTHTPFSYVLHP